MSPEIKQFVSELLALYHLIQSNTILCYLIPSHHILSLYIFVIGIAHGRITTRSLDYDRRSDVDDIKGMWYASAENAWKLFTEPWDGKR